MVNKKVIHDRKPQGFQEIDKLRLLDNDLMTIVFDKNIEATELLLQIIMNRNDLKVLEVVAQREYKNPMQGGRSITLDIYAQDLDGKVYNVEVQRTERGADFHRARFHSSMIDTKMLRKRQDFKEINDSYVIFITENDVIGAGKPVYHVNRIIEETGYKFEDGSHIIYVNGSYQNHEDAIGKLMHDFRCVAPEDMYYPQLAIATAHFKRTEGGKKNMSSVVEEYAKEVAEWRVMEEKIAIAKNLLSKGDMSKVDIAEVLQLSLEDIEEIITNTTNN